MKLSGGSWLESNVEVGLGIQAMATSVGASHGPEEATVCQGRSYIGCDGKCN